MANIKVTDQELKSILTELESELSAALSGTALVKAEGEDKPEEGSKSGGDKKAPPKKDEGSDAPPPAEGSDAPPPAEGSDAPPPAPGADAPPPAAPSAAPAAPEAPVTPAADPGSAPAPAAPAVDPAAAAAPAPAAPADPAMLQAEYAQLPPEELKAHYLAAKAALFQVMGGAQPAPAPAPIPAPAPAPAAAPVPTAPPAPPVPPVMKGEKMPTEENGKLPGTPTSPDIAKSEKAELDALKLQLETMTKALTLIAGVPMQKAVTDLTYVAKSEDSQKETELNPAQIRAKLDQVARNPLTKNEDRNLMNKYVCGSVDVSAIKHLLK